MARCPICTKEVEMITTKNGTIVSCSCGLSSKLFKEEGSAETWINTRAGKPAERIAVGNTLEKKAVRL
jgi:hypothetical protein